MVKETTHKVTKEVEEVIGKKLYCDICGKVISQEDLTDERYQPPVWYYELTIGHNDWGNDSIDSIEHKDICSVECLSKEYSEYIERSDCDCNSEYFDVRRAKF